MLDVVSSVCSVLQVPLSILRDSFRSSGLKLIEAGEPETVIARNVQISCEVQLLQIEQIHFSAEFSNLKALVYAYVQNVHQSTPMPFLQLIQFHGAKGKASERRLAVSNGYLLDTAATFTASP